MLPFNIELLVLHQMQIKMLGEVTDVQIMEQNSKAFNENGLYSTHIFGTVGSEERNERYGYIDLHVPVMHPLVYKHVTSLCSLYKNILSGSQYAIFDKKTKNFIQSDIENGQTGYAFFLKHFKDIKFVETDSVERQYKIKLINKYKYEEIMFSKLLVLPAGLRDYTIDKNDKPSEDEVNTIYRRIINIASLLKTVDVERDETIINPTRFRLQTTIVELYDYFISLLDGKNKFILGKWTKRATTYGTRNVATGLPIVKTNMFDKSYPTVNHTIIGIYQASKAMTPITRFHFRDKVISKIFTESSDQVMLFNKNFEPITKVVDYKIKDKWTSNDGIDSLLSKLGDINTLHKLVTIEDNYPILAYDDGKVIKFLFANNYTLPEGKDKRHLRPVTVGEMIYYCICDVVGKYPGFVTRYPVSSTGGIYPSYTYLKTTVKGRRVKILDDFWNVRYEAVEYPIQGESYYNSMTTALTRVNGLSLDYDGDTLSMVLVYSEESIREIDKYLNSLSAYIDGTGKLLASASNDVIDNILKDMTA